MEGAYSRSALDRIGKGWATEPSQLPASSIRSSGSLDRRHRQLLATMPMRCRSHSSVTGITRKGVLPV